MNISLERRHCKRKAVKALRDPGESVVNQRQSRKNPQVAAENSGSLALRSTRRSTPRRFSGVRTGM
jgi:hypothetical protein